ncbi:MAG: site-specific integrase [Myxococcota bacterium]
MTTTPGDPLLHLVESFFREHLQNVRGASRHTVLSYRDALRLFLIFLADTNAKPASKLTLDDIVVDRVLAFLEHLETRRHNRVSTRNQRLAAIHAFTEHLLRHDPTRAGQYSRILDIPSKKSKSSTVVYLEPEEVQVLLRMPDTRTAAGRRDHALLLLLYNTGARVSEAIAVCARDIQTDRPRQVRLHGKGNKDRVCPLWNETAEALMRFPHFGADPDSPIFQSARGTPLTRDGVAYILAKYAKTAGKELPTLAHTRVTPHVLRHSCAVALLQAGVDITVIRDYLGHASIATTNRYISTNLQMKRDVLEAFWKRSGLAPSAVGPWHPPADVLAFLESL